MNKKKKTYVLLVLVIIIWGFIGYYIYKYLNPDVPQIETISQKRFVPKMITAKSNDFAISNYRDPFLGSINTVKKPTGVLSSQVQQVVFPKVIYNGIVKGNNTKQFIISINNQQEMMKVGTTIQGVKLMQANSKQIIVRFNKISKTIMLQQ